MALNTAYVLISPVKNRTQSIKYNLKKCRSFKEGDFVVISHETWFFFTDFDTFTEGDVELLDAHVPSNRQDWYITSSALYRKPSKKSGRCLVREVWKKCEREAEQICPREMWDNFKGSQS